MKHGNESFFIKGEGLIVAPLFPPEVLRGQNISKGILPLDVTPKSGDTVPMPTKNFCRLFEKGEQPDGDSLVDLGQLMETETGVPEDDRDNNIPAGYVYLGQFIDHDMTLDSETELSIDESVEPDHIENFRTPSLDLDSLYLEGPENNPELYESDGKKFKIGSTTDVDSLGSFPNDLPRKGSSAGAGERATDAWIADNRNDENLAVAQTHVSFLKFHNTLVDENPGLSFDKVREEVTLHYQAIVLTDFLPRVLDQDVLNDVLTNGRRFYTDNLTDCMPMEFSVAAYRMGHSMIRPSYEWNRILNSNGDGGIATFHDIFEFSGLSGTRGEETDLALGGNPTLPSKWIVDWSRLYDFSDVGGGTHEQLNYNRKLDAQMALDLKTLPEFQQKQHEEGGESIPDIFLSLATRNLLRGRLVSLPTGQQVATAIGETALTSEEIVSNVAPEQADVLRGHGFDTDTPLWYYILREAMVQNDGNCLGRVGSRIVAETIIGSMENSNHNVIEERPDLSYSMPEMLMRIDDVNPLGD